MERPIKAVLQGNPSRHRQECLEYGTTLGHHITICMDRAIKIGANNLDRQQHPIRTLDQDKKIPMPWMLTGHRSEDLLLNVINVRNWGT